MNNESKSLPIRIAYAEDERWFRDTIAKMLIESGFEITIIASDGDELIQRINSSLELPDVFLTDLRMPKMHGIQATREILSRWPCAKVIVLSSEVERFYVEEVRKAGAVAFLHKIIDHKNIVKALKEVYYTGATNLGSFKKLDM